MVEVPAASQDGMHDIWLACLTSLFSLRTLHSIFWTPSPAVDLQQGHSVMTRDQVASKKRKRLERFVDHALGLAIRKQAQRYDEETGQSFYAKEMSDHPWDVDYESACKNAFVATRMVLEYCFVSNLCQLPFQVS